MNRRHFLRQAMLAGSALAFAPSWLRAQEGAPLSPFAQARAREAWLAGWDNAPVTDSAPRPVEVQGRLPAALAGVLYRNGPAWFERDGVRYRHWFDGDGMMHAWHLGSDGVQHQARMIGTSKFTREQQAGRFLLPAGGTSLEHTIAIRNNDDMNTANTAVVMFGDQLYALWEGGSAIPLDTQTLQARGPKTWRADLQAAPFSAHPLIDTDGSLWNFGALSMLGSNGVLIWQLGADGSLRQSSVLADAEPSYLHSFCMTANHLVFVLHPMQAANGRSYFERWQYATSKPCRVAIVPKQALDQPRWFEVDFAAIYHWADAVEHQGVIQARAVRHRDAARARSPMAATLRGEHDDQPPPTELVTLRVDLARNRAEWITEVTHSVEFPCVDPRGNGRGLIYAPTRHGETSAPYFNAVCAIDTRRDRLVSHSYGRDVMAEEHLFVPRPGSRRAGQGWLIGTVLDHRHGRSGVAVLDAEHIADGPIATAWLDRLFPLGFHGSFVARR